jgi:DNA recombination protein RmuC
MEIAVIILAVVVVSLGAYLIVQKQSLPKENQTSTLLIKEDLNQLSQSLNQIKENLHLQVSDRIEKSQAMMMGSLQKQNSESNKLITEVTRHLTELQESNKQVVGITDELKVLQNVLQNPKQRGVLGEYYLHSVLENVLPPDRYHLQHKFKDGEIVDAVIVLDKGKLLPVDSKFTLENYNRLIEEKDKIRREVYVKQFKQDLKNRIDETSKYIRPAEKTMDFAFMFIPSEAIYYDLLINKVGVTSTSSRDLIEYAFRDKHVVIVSPTSFMAYLQTVLQGLRSLQIEEKAQEIQIRVGELGRHISTYEELMQKLGNSLGTSVSHFNTAHKELKKVDKDVVKIAGTTASVEPMVLDKPSQDDD